MKAAVVGGTGLAGRHVVDALQARGVDTVVLSRRGGVDVATGAGLDEALSGVQRVVDASNAGTTDEAAARAFFTAAGRHLQQAGERAHVERLVVLSIVGVDRASGGYLATKLDHERTARSGTVPTFVLRSTQFHEFAGQTLAWGRQGDVCWIPEFLVQPVAVAAMARVLADLVLAMDPRPGVSEVAGPQQEKLVDMATRLAARRGDPVEVRGAPDDSADGRAFAGGALLPDPGATITGPTFQEWLDAGERDRFE
ncbi:MAG: epimerase [Luteitalea sp.]|nr:epimerase [Luteitalea sp.]